MSKGIYKYPVPVTASFTLDMPRGAEVLTVQVQHGEPVLWALVDVAASLERREFAVHGTGHEMPEGERRYVGTFQLEGGHFIGHLFEVL
jgi:hypothetical protein